MDWKATNTSSTEQHRKSKLRTNDTNQRIWSTNKQIPIDIWLSAKQWAGERDPGLAESECKHVQYQISQMTPCGPVCNLLA